MDNSGMEEAKFDEMIQDYTEAFNAGDYRRVASHWAEDGVHLPPTAQRFAAGPCSTRSVASARGR